jgi:hypothetical protein
MTFCVFCGQEKSVKEFTGNYDSKTGERVYRYICPVGCAHEGHDSHLVRGTSFFGFCTSEFVCKRCGAKGFFD